MKKFIYLILIANSIQVCLAQKPNVISSMCDNYTFVLEDDFGCGNLYFLKQCDEETIWNWGDGTPEFTSKDRLVQHKFCKAGTYLVTIRLSGSPTIIRHSLTVSILQDVAIDFNYQILSQSGCSEVEVDFNSIATCLEAYDINKVIIPGSDKIEWDFGDGTISNNPNEKHKYTNAGIYTVTLRSVSSPCEVYKTIILDLGDPIVCCLDNFSFTHSTFTSPMGLSNWAGGTFSIEKELRIPTGSQLNLDNVRLEMGKEAKIIVENGAILEIRNSIITTTGCGGYNWEGIEVWGKGDYEYQYINLGTGSGFLLLENSTIENADEAVSLTRKKGLGFYENDFAYNGGIINAHNSTFRNNFTSINFFPFITCPYTAIADTCGNCEYFIQNSIVEDNNFICNAPMRDPKYTTYEDANPNTSYRLGMSHFIYINGNYKVNLSNNNFTNLYTSIPSKYRGIGINSIHSGISVTQTKFNVTGFRGLKVGIQAIADNSTCKRLLVSKVKFNNCEIGIDANSVNLIVSNCNFSIPKITSALATQGIHSRNCFQFEIDSNVFIGSVVGKKYGVLLKNNQKGNLFNNTFLGIEYSNQLERNNYESTITCNKYQNTNFAINIPSGRIKQIGSIFNPAGNQFYDACLNSSNNMNHIKSVSGFKYYYGNENYAYPVCKSPNVIPDHLVGRNPNCLTRLPNPCNPKCTYERYLQLIQEAKLAADNYGESLLETIMAHELLDIVGGSDYYVHFLDSISSESSSAIKILCGNLLAEKKFNELGNRLNQLNNLNQEENKGYTNLFNMLNKAGLENRDVNNLTGDEVLLLNEIANNDTTDASYIAEGILYSLYGYDYDHNPLVENELQRPTHNVLSKLESQLIIAPNPSSAYVSVMSENSKIKSIKIFDYLGRERINKKLNDYNITLPVYELVPGLYKILIETEKGQESKSLMIK